MGRHIGTCVGVIICVTAFAQEPPRPLPPSVTGTPRPVAPQPQPPVSPAAGVAPPTQQSTAPIGRFQNLSAFPAETATAVTSVKAGADWLWRMNQANGRFLPGLNPATRTPLDTDHDLRQALAALALADAGRFTGDDRFTARATQAILTLLTLTRPDPADPACRVPSMAGERCNRVAFAAAVALAVYRSPAADPALMTSAEQLCGFVRKQCQPTGAIGSGDGPAKTDTEGQHLAPGLAIQALTANLRVKPDAANRDLVTRSVAFYRSKFQTQPHPLLAAGLVPGFVEFALLSGKDVTATAGVFEMADWLCQCQYTRADAPNPAWAGGFKGCGSPPGWEAAWVCGAMASAAKLTRHVPDLARFGKYRQAAIDGFAFARALQYSDENADHFERTYRARFLTGGVHLSPADGTIRIDATAALVCSQFAFLESGAEGRVD
ncbi:MAG: hypothetical protein U0871_15705 [Gemmataceae bacterium]